LKDISEFADDIDASLAEVGMIWKTGRVLRADCFACTHGVPIQFKDCGWTRDGIDSMIVGRSNVKDDCR
jgi:hypothetical protein